MKKILSLVLASAALAYAPAASAADFLPNDASGNFIVVGNPDGSQVVNGFIGNNVRSGSGTDRFIFRIGPPGGQGIGLGSGVVSTTFNINSGSLVFSSVTFSNGTSTFNVPIVPLGTIGSSAFIGNVPIFSGAFNTLTVNYLANGAASYGGQLRFTPGGIPEPMTWAMMIIGFAATGFAMRRRNKQVARVRYAY